MNVINDMSAPKILFLDDDYLLIKAVELIVRDLNYEFYLLTSVREARLLLRTTQFQVIYSDYHMPEKNGVEFLEEASFFSPHAARILVSASLGDAEGQQAAKNPKIHRYLKKPFGRAIFHDSIADGLLIYAEQSLNR